MPTRHEISSDAWKQGRRRTAYENLRTSDRHPLNAAHDGTPFPRGVAVFITSV